ncbi:Smr/MutS family protein [Marinobacterium stanieri]|uniref:DNA-nicking endonuclease, Smr domain n=1 Tax=Marinobacterium stanieri TaxID=49186 RepID=A0A1N6PVI6_9GAMM|nr:Smr/MutS family protein [Marinobacterium stanieri]SIQ08297.1 DNA-nicking endonuclease, Smr domain [Marinobacterium stanieri]
MSYNSDQDHDDDLDFGDAMQGVTPLKHDRHHDLGQAPARIKPRQDNASHYRRQAAEREVERVIDGLSSEAKDILDSNDELLFAAPGVQFATLKRLRKGHIPWEGGLDLHGYSVDQARDELSLFIRDACRQNLRAVLVVHGKAYTQPGQPALLKSCVNDWLRQLNNVLAFCSAQPRDGGTGAVYVLLKRQAS